MFLMWITGLIGICLVSGCGSYQLEEEPENEEETGEAPPEEAAITMALDNPEAFPSLYPLRLYLFNSSDQCVYEDEIASETEMPVISQPKGTYVMSVFSGLSSGEYAFPMELHPRQLLTFSRNCCAAFPLVVGKSHIEMSGDIRVSLKLSYAVACVDFSFGYFPEDVTEVTVHLSPVSSGISLGGDVHTDDKFATIVCSKVGPRWKSGPVYVIPSDANRLHLSLRLTQNGEETVYGYDYNSALVAGKVYHFEGDEEGEIHVDDEDSQVSGWVSGEDVEIEFDDFEQEGQDDWKEPDTDDGKDEEETPPFEVDDEEDETPSGGEDDVTGDDGPVGDVSGGDVSGGDSDILYADELPEAESIWGPFFVWKVEQLSATSVKAVLMAPRQWMELRDDAVAICDAYEIDGIGEWRVLTLEEAKEFRDQYDETIVQLSEYLYDNGIDSFNKYDLRYLCDDFNTTFCFYNQRTSKAGKTVKYGLRLFKEVVVEKR